MMQRVMPDLMGLKNIMVLNGEAHHCYRRKVDSHRLRLQLRRRATISFAEKSQRSIRITLGGDPSSSTRLWKSASAVRIAV
jgi:type III restriction enzyme